MNSLALILAVFLLANLLVALLRVARGPTPADRLLAALLFGTTGVAILLLRSLATDNAALRDAALVFALRAASSGAAFAQRAWREEQAEATQDD